MSVFNDKSFQEYLQSVRDLRLAHKFTTGWKCGSKACLQTDGIFESPNGYSFRVTYDEKDRTYMLWASKGSANLRGEISEDGQFVVPSEDGVSKAYPIAEYRLRDDESNKDAIFEAFAKAMRKFDEELSDRSDHTIYMGASFVQNPVLNYRADSVSYENADGYDVFSNLKGYDVLTLDKLTNDAQKHLSIYRSDGHFKPVRFRRNVVMDGISAQSVNISRYEDYLSARFAMDESRRSTSQAVWEQHNLYMNEGFTFFVRSLPKRILNYLHDKKAEVAVNASVLGGVSVMHPDYTWGALLGSVGGHLALHESAREFWKNLPGAWERACNKIAHRKVEKYDFGENIVDRRKSGFRNVFFGRHNLHKFAPHANVKELDRKSLVYLNSDEVARLNEKMHAEYVDDLTHDALDIFILKMPNMCLPMKDYPLDRSTFGFEGDNACAGLSHRGSDRSATVYAKVNPALCMNEGLFLPEGYVEQFKNNVIKIEAKKKGHEWVIDQTHSFLKPEDAVYEINQRVLFKNQAYTDKYVQQASRRSVFELFTPDVHPVERMPLDAEEKARLKGMGVVTLPFAEAIKAPDVSDDVLGGHEVVEAENVEEPCLPEVAID